MPSTYVSRDTVPISHELGTSDHGYRVGTDLRVGEVYAIGYVTVMWAFLEHALYVRTAEMADNAGIPLPRDATSTAFKRRLRAWRLLIEETISDDDKRNHWLRIVDQIANAEQDRHKISHGLWGYDPDYPDNSQAYSFRPSFEYDQRFNHDKLCKLCDRIAKINFEMMDFPGNNPLASWADENGHVAFASVSRSGPPSPESLAPEDPRLYPATLPEPMPPRSPSKE